MSKNQKTTKTSKSNKGASKGEGAAVKTPAPVVAPQKIGRAVKQALPDGFKIAERANMTHANGAGFSTQRPGVLAFMQELLERAHASKRPISKGELLDALCAQFPDRTREKMKTTIAMQVPSGFMLEKGIIVNVTAGEDGKRYSINPNTPRVAKDDRKGYNRDE